MLDIQYESIIANYMRALSVEINPSKSYSKVTSTIISLLSKFTKKDFRDITREDIIDFLDTLRKPEEIDPLHKWIGSYNLYLGVLIRFFKWFNYQSLPHRERPKPPVIMNIPHLKRKEKSIYKSSDMWTSDDDLIFLKYCSSKRNRCYHAIAKDISCRPHEILNLKIKDIVFKMAGDRQYAEIIVNGKTGQRHIPIINSILYLKDWLDDHPFRISPNSNLICGLDEIEDMKREIQIMKEGNKEWIDLLRDPMRLLGILRRDANLNELKC